MVEYMLSSLVEFFKIGMPIQFVNVLKVRLRIRYIQIHALSRIYT